MPSICGRCQSFGHPTQACTAALRCSRCGEEGHRAIDCKAIQQRCANCGSTTHSTVDRSCPRHPAAPSSLATTVPLQAVPPPTQKVIPNTPEDKPVTTNQLLSILSIVLANTHPHERSTVALILSKAAEAVLGIKVTPSYSNYTITPIITYASLLK
ncbi:hypothetical protein J437_LFUL008880 [Ladona fulva]|uniref:CCHC-type domain-containing protein n=1 Tax=Ladona fulva TaxID=123851 RepID=A0A8K0KE01_LADFU|nr:hypothetical protein J437_LFUL008880 [Ladona fulva]